MTQNTLSDKINMTDGSLVIYKIEVKDETQEEVKPQESTETKPKIKWDLT